MNELVFWQERDNTILFKLFSQVNLFSKYKHVDNFLEVSDMKCMCEKNRASIVILV
jgi:hypothetical protein